jgi:hypothetical protein
VSGSSVLNDDTRRAALTVHALTDADRAWILDHVSDDQRLNLQTLLEELTALGIPRDPELIDDALKHVAVTVPTLALGSVSPDELAEAIRREPPNVQLMCLALTDPQRREVLSGLLGRQLQHTSDVRAIPKHLGDAIETVWRDMAEQVSARKTTERTN